jgi:acyl carrier protein
MPSTMCPTAPTDPTPPGADSDPLALERELATVLIEALNLDTTPEAVDPTAPLYGEGLGLDSIDILEVALEVSRRYGFQLRSDDENNPQIFQSLRSLARHVAQHRTV